MKKHSCYYCGEEIVKDIVLVTFYTKKCNHCDVTYHLDLNHQITLIVMAATFQNKKYSVVHSPSRGKTAISKRREKLVWHGNINSGWSAEILPTEVIEFDADYNTINPSNLNERLKIILTFL